MDGMSMMLKSFGFDPKKLMADVEEFKTKVEGTLEAINGQYLVVLKGQQIHSEQLQRIEKFLEAFAVEFDKAKGSVANQHNEIRQLLCKALEGQLLTHEGITIINNRMGELWKELRQPKDPLSAIPLVHPLPQQQPPAQTPAQPLPLSQSEAQTMPQEVPNNPLPW